MANRSNDELAILEDRPKPVGLPKWALLFVTEKELGSQAASCNNCTILLKRQKRCSILGPDIIIDAVKKDGQTFTPVCGQHDPGKPMDVADFEIEYSSALQGEEKADLIGLEWAEGKGTNCGGKNGAAGCKFYGGSSAEEFCTPLQEEVYAGDCCAAHKGPAMSWREAQKILKGK